MQLTTYLFFQNNAADAFDFYARCLGGKIISKVTYADMPDCPDMPEQSKSLVANVCLKAGDSMLMASDCPPGAPFDSMQGCAVAIGIESVEQAERVFAALGDGGTITMPIAETSWAQRFGTLTDRFGIQWMVNCNRPEAGGAP